jgi:uncharacterized protein
MRLEFILFGSVVFFTSALLQGLSGFGFSILAIPLISFILIPKTSVPILLIYSIIINITVLASTRKALDLKKIWLLLLGAVIAIPFGTKLLIILPENIIRGFIGILILIFGTVLLSGLRIKFKRSKLIMLPIGFLSGILGASISISGPPIIIYFTSLETEKQEFRGNLAIYFFLLNLFTIPVYFMNGLFTGEVLRNTLIYLPALVAGVLTGNLISSKIKDSHFRLITLYLLLVMGITSIISVIF